MLLSRLPPAGRHGAPARMNSSSISYAMEPRPLQPARRPSAAATPAARAAAPPSSAAPPLARRRPLIKRRKMTRRQRMVAPRKDVPARLEVDPESPEFEGRLTAALASAWGPISLGKLLADYGGAMSGEHLSLALSMLAGFLSHRHKLSGAFAAARDERPPLPGTAPPLSAAEPRSSPLYSL
jgi:hypothetical protein